MKKLFSIPIFFVLFAICMCVGDCRGMAIAMEPKRTITVSYDAFVECYEEKEIISNNKFLNSFTPQEILIKLKDMGFSSKECIDYVYSGISAKILEVEKVVNIEPVEADVDVTKGTPIIKHEQMGLVLDEERLYEDLYNNLIHGDNNIKVNLKCDKLEPNVKMNEVINYTNEKSSFRTYINGVNQEGRRLNIKRATQLLNGIRLLPEEKLSFNQIIGETTKANGYALAKVILNGEYKDDYGGGVCQVATTLYNAALIAGLDIERVRPHSLKVGYVAGSFDAMVSAGVSDLVIKNPYDTPIYIYSYATDYECGVKIFGEINEFDIQRRTEIVDFNEEEYPSVSYMSEGYLDYFKNNELVKTKRIRKDTYKKVKVLEPKP